MLPLVSCNDWLDLHPETATTLTGYFKNENELESWMYSVFIEQKLAWAISYPSQHEYTGLLCSDGGAYEGYRRLDPLTCLSKTRSWGWNYNMIYFSDVLIENRFRFKNVTDERADFWVAQANFAKAFAYFDLARRWGDAPIPKSSESQDPEPKQPVEKVLAKAIECAEAALILPKHEDLRDSYGAKVTSKQFASLGTVNTLLAHIYAWMGGLYGDEEYWRKAEAAASLVIDGKAGNYDLEKTIPLMLANCQGGVRNSVETIFDIELNSIDEDYTGLNDFSMHYPGMMLINYPYLATDPHQIENDASAMKITVERVKEVYSDSRDARRGAYWYRLGEVKYWDAAASDSVVSEYAFLDKWHETVYQDNKEEQDNYTGVMYMEGNRVVWRLADLILLRAECRARLGMATAKDDLDRVRLRAGLREYSGSTNPETLRREIFRERERELFGEGHRYFDVVRNGYFREEFDGNYKTLTDEDVKNGALYLPIPAGADNKNPYMKENTYWSWLK